MSQYASNLDSIVRHIDVILDGSNYSMWAQNMEVFLKGHRLWRYLTGAVPKLVQKDNEKEEFASHMEEWDSIHYKILSWFINTSIPSINSLLPRLGNATVAWDFLAKSNCTYDASLEFQLEAKLYQMRQELGQSISDFYSQTNHLWEQLSAANPKLDCSKDIQTFATWLDRQKFMHFMMALWDDFESTRASLLHCQPLPTIDATISELISEETRRSTMKMQSSDMVLATASRGTSQSSTWHSSSQSTSKTGFCKWCKRNGHTINECRKF